MALYSRQEQGAIIKNGKILPLKAGELIVYIYCNSCFLFTHSLSHRSGHLSAIVFACFLYFIFIYFLNNGIVTDLH